MDAEQYHYTLNALQVCAADLESATASYSYLATVGKDQLTPELETAFRELASACKEYLAALE